MVNISFASFFLALRLWLNHVNAVEDKVENLHQTFSSQKRLISDSLASTASAKRMLDRLDTNIEPCDDFYQYSCGKWLDRQKIPDDASVVDDYWYLGRKMRKRNQGLLEKSVNESFTAEAKIKRLYRQCKDEANTENWRGNPLLHQLKNLIDGWPILDSNWNASKFHLLDAIVNSFFMDTDVFFRISVVPQLANPTVNTVLLEGPRTFRESSIIHNHLTGSLYNSSYWQLLFDVTTILLRDTNQSRIDLNKLIPNITAILETDQFLTEVKDVISDQKHPIKLALFEFPKLFRSSLLKNMTGIVRGCFKRANLPYHEVNGNTTVTVKNLAFLSILDYELNQLEQQGTEGLKRIANFIGWRAIRSTLPFLARDYRDALGKYNRKIWGQVTTFEPSAGERCADGVAQAMPLAMGVLYARDSAFKSAKQQATVLSKAIQSEFKGMLDAVSWLDKDSKKAAHNKLSTMTVVVGYPEIAETQSELIDAEYENITLGGCYMQSRMQITSDRFSRELRRITRPGLRYDPLRDSEDIASMNMYYNWRNFITPSAIFLQSPVFDRHSPEYDNYAGLGFFFGHEITHGFDSYGMFYNSDGANKLWWTSTAQAGFLSAVLGMKEQYDSYASVVGKANGSLTLAENIADNAGARAAYKAYVAYMKNLPHPKPVPARLKHYSHEQLFFISFAQVWSVVGITSSDCAVRLADYQHGSNSTSTKNEVCVIEHWCNKRRPESESMRLIMDQHSSATLRVNGVVANMIEFSQAFKCPHNASMNPPRKHIVY